MNTRRNTNYTKTVNGPAVVAEGDDYTYLAQADNPSPHELNAPKYRCVTFLDILPYANDVHAYENLSGGQPKPRGSEWNGWIKDLDSIK